MSKPIKIMYALHPGEVRARDGDVHFISAEQLIRLYGVHPQMCVIARKGWDRTYHPDFLEQFVHLYPREDGKYTTADGFPNLSNGNRRTTDMSQASPREVIDR
jgi:hypothetical protein